MSADRAPKSEPARTLWKLDPETPWEEVGEIVSERVRKTECPECGQIHLGEATTCRACEARIRDVDEPEQVGLADFGGEK